MTTGQNDLFWEVSNAPSKNIKELLLSQMEKQTIVDVAGAGFWLHPMEEFYFKFEGCVVARVNQVIV